MSSHKKKKFLTFEEQSIVLKKIHEGVSKEEIMRKYDISKSTYYSLTDRESQILKNIHNRTMKKRKLVRKCNESNLDTAMIKWFMQVRDRGDPISGPIIQEKALILNKKLNGSPTFKASNGWLRSFKERYSIRQVEMKGEKLSNDVESTGEFSEFLKQKIDSENLLLENIYNADESGIYWRTLVTCIHAQNSEEQVSGPKEIKDRVTALFCSNSSGNHRIPLLLIGKSMIPKCLNGLLTPELNEKRLKFLSILNVIYTHQTNSWMDTNIFKLWYTDEFIPRVLNHQKLSNITGKVILILDNAPSHPPLEELNAVNDNFEVIYLPPNVIDSIQPMDQGLIAATKKMYKKNLLRRLLIDNELQGADEFLKKFDLRDCMVLLKKSWESVKSSTLKAVWKPLLTDRIVIEQQADNQEASVNLCEEVNFPYDISSQLSSLFEGPNFGFQENFHKVLLKWFETDHYDCGWEPWSDENFIDFVSNDQKYPKKVYYIEINDTENHHESYEMTMSEAMRGVEAIENWIQSSENVPQHYHQYIEEIKNSLINEIEATEKNCT